MYKHTHTHTHTHTKRHVLIIVLSVRYARISVLSVSDLI